VQLRPARPQEAAALSAIALEAKAALGYAEPLLQSWREALRIDAETIRQQLVQVATCEGTVAGFFCVDIAAAEARLEHLWVKPALQGRGAGSALMQEALRLASSRGARTMLIDAEPKAEAFYRRMGFERIGTVAAPIPGEPGRVRPQMRRELP
jgi:ribosomal protein S18 acetylase RimI-like enzyme